MAPIIAKHGKKASKFKKGETPVVSMLLSSPFLNQQSIIYNPQTSPSPSPLINS
jgi:hypothetical protein